MAVVGIVAASHSALALTVAFVLSGVTYSNTTFPFSVSKGDSLVSWTYAAGDFANGSGQIIYLNLPPGTVYPYYATTNTVEAGQITSALANANVDSYWYDLMISYAPSLSNPNSQSTVTGGSYDLTSNGEMLGSVIGGRVLPYQPSLAVQPIGTNVIITWPTNYADGFVLESAASLTSSTLWTTSSIPPVVGFNYQVTNSVVTGTRRFFRLVR
jgi:hypothetical protein